MKKIIPTNVDYSQYDKEPGKSVSLLNNDPGWSKFVRYESDNDKEIVARFKRKEFEDFVLNFAFEKGKIKSKIIEECIGYELNIYVRFIITTYQCWANKNEPIISIGAQILDTNKEPGLNRCVFDYKYFVRAPFMGYLDTSSFYQECEKEGGRIYQLYTSQRAREKWPRILSENFYDDLQNKSHIVMHFNEYMYDEHFYDGIPFWAREAEGKSPCIKFDWKVKSFSTVVQGQHVCSIIKNPYESNRKEYKIYSPVSGIIVIGKNGDNKEYTHQMGMEINDLFTLYKDKQCLLFWKYNIGNEAIKSVDSFEESVSLSWEKVAGRYLPLGEDEFLEEGYRGFEMISDSGKYIVVSLQVKSNVPYIVFSVNSRILRLSNGDAIDLLFENDFGEKSVLSFPIRRNYVYESFKDIYDSSFFCELSKSDIECMRNNSCVSWKVRFSKQPLMSIVGHNESAWCPREYAGDVFKAYVEEYIGLIEELKDEYHIVFSSRQTNSSLSSEEACYVYLMLDKSNGYYKIGVSNNPEYRERTLQSEKPTIEKLCAKEFPNRTIAFAIESALHKSFENKRIRGEWFALNANDVITIIATLS